MKQNLSIKTHRQAIKMALCSLTLVASVTAQAALPSPNSGMATITDGWFLRGDAIDNESDAHTNQVFVSAFQMDTNLITWANWQLVYQDALNRGYSFSTNATGFGPNDPVQTVSWYDAVKWCNARSQMEGLTPCYYTDINLTLVYTSGTIALKTNNVNWTANGYRLPTEAEWEKAARGGLTANRFPRGMTIAQSLARYQSAMVLSLSYDLGPANSIPLSTKPVGSYLPNGFGLYDMAGNVDEWCWDFYSSTYYSSTTANNPHGPGSGSARIARGGDWNSAAPMARCAARASYAPSLVKNLLGFRCVRIADAGQPAASSVTVNVGTYTYNGSPQGPASATVTGSTGSVTYSYVGVSGTTYGPSATLPTSAGNYTVTATVAADANYNGASSIATPFSIGKMTPTLGVNVSSYIYNGSPQGPNTVTTVSSGSVTYSYLGVSVTYGPSSTQPTAAGNYTVTATVAAAGNYTGASSGATAFSIALASPSGIVDFGSLTNLLGTNKIDLADLKAVLKNYSPSNGIVDSGALTSFLGTSTVTLAELKTVLGNYSHSGIVDYGALTNFLGNDSVTTNDLSAVLNNFYNPSGKVAVAALTKLLGGTTNIVDQEGLNAVLAHYWASSPPYINNAAFPGTNFTFAVTNFTFTVQVNTNLINRNGWKDIGPAMFGFADTNAVTGQPSRFYRIVTPVN